MYAFKPTRFAASVGAVVLLAAGFAAPAQATVTSAPAGLTTAATTSDPSVDRADKVIRCVVIDQQRFCTEIGFVLQDKDSASWKSSLANELSADVSGSGDLGLGALVKQLESLSPSELAQRQDQQIADARRAAARMTLVDAITYGTTLPSGFFAKHPELGIAESSIDAAVFRAQAANPSEMALTERLAKAGLRAPDGAPGRVSQGTSTVATSATADGPLLGSKATAASGLAQAASSLPLPIPSSRYPIADAYATVQENNYYCGPATMQSIDWADDGGKDSQATWAGLLRTTTVGTYIGSMTSVTNSSTNWDSLNTGGTYTIVSTAGRDAAWFTNVHQVRIGYYGGPVIEHVLLKMAYFWYLNSNHGGHYQTGRGYDATTVGIFEPFHEAGHTLATKTDGPKSVTYLKMFNATVANLANFGA